MHAAGGTAAVVSWLAFSTSLLQATPALCTEFEFSAVGAYRASSTATVGPTASYAVNLGHCCSLCAIIGACAAVNYVAATSTCELVPSQGLSWTADAASLLLLKVNVMGNSVPASFQAVSGALVQSGRREGFTSYSLQRTRGAAHCYSLCHALTTDCRLFAFHMKMLLCYVYDVDFYATWTTTTTDDAGWTSYYAKQTGGWKLLYKMSKGIGVDASNALFTSGGNATASAAQMAQDATCACWLKNAIVGCWSKFPITQVSLVLATAGATMKYLNFSTTSVDTAATFFQQRKIVASSWTDLSAMAPPSLNLMYIGTPIDNSGGRYFLISSVYNGCAGDIGWLSVHGTGAAPCPYDAGTVPQFAYSKGTTYDFMVNAAFADVLLLYAKL